MEKDELLKLIDQAHREGWTELDLSDQDLTELPPEIGQLTALQYLALNHNHLTILPTEIGQLTALQFLGLSDNKLTVLPPEIGRLTNLQFLDLSDNLLSSFPSEIGQLTTLLALDLNYNNLTALPSELYELTALQRLSLRDNRLTVLSPEIGHLTALKTLDLGHDLFRSGERNQLITLPSEISLLTELQQLYLNSNRLTALPPEIGQLTKLQFFDLGDNSLRVIPLELCELVALRKLDLDKNRLTTLPKKINQWTALQELLLSYNHLTDLPTEIGQLVKLRYLNANGNELTVIPPEIGQLIALRHLDLRNNRLTILPPEIGRLTKLQYLHLDRNQLTDLPPEINLLEKLQYLHLNENQLTSLPSEIGLLTELQSLQIDSNQLMTLPPEINQLVSLQFLSLNKNPDFPLPPEILKKTDDPQAVIRAYLDYRAGQSRPLNEVKLVLVGEGSVGKTSLVNRLLYDMFDPGENKTEGIAIHRWFPPSIPPTRGEAGSVPSGEGEEKGGQIRVNVWDFGGQEIMHATHQFFLTKRTLYVLVLDSRYSEAENRLDYWLTLIRSFGEDSPILVVGNKTDQHALDLDRRGLLAKHSTVQAILDTSCATGAGIPALHEAIAQQISLMPHVADPLAATWFDVKAELEAMDADYIPYADYVHLCREKTVDHPDSQRVLLGFLHDLGVVLHFPDPRLETTNILNPEWVTQGVYRILNTRLLFAEPGILTWDMLARILDDEPYQEKRMFIVDMMQKFELCYELPDRPDTYLIPDLLPKEEPDTGTWGDALRFEVHYPVLPGSILTRLIVRMHRHIPAAPARPVWRTGVLLACDGNEALVKADLVANRITIAVRGPAYGRRELLTRIREHLGGIHGSLAGLEAAEKVPVPGHPKIPAVDYTWLRELERKGVPEFYPPGLTEPVNVRHLLDGVEARGGRGSGLSGGVLSRLRETLLRCGPLDSDAALRTLFTDERLYPWHDRIPDSTHNREARVDALIDALLEQRTSRGESALSHLLHVLAEKIDPDDALHDTLTRLAEETG